MHSETSDNLSFQAKSCEEGKSLAEKTGAKKYKKSAHSKLKSDLMGLCTYSTPSLCLGFVALTALSALLVYLRTMHLHMHGYNV